jgi:hypothetical protein
MLYMALCFAVSFSVVKRDYFGGMPAASAKLNEKTGRK